MVRKGERVVQPTKKVGQVPRTGTVLEVRDQLVDVRWDNGHESTVTREFLLPEKDDKRSA